MGTLFALIGFCDIISRALLLPKLLIFPERQIGRIGIWLIILGFIILILGGYFTTVSLLWAAIIFITLGEGLFDPSYNNLLSQSVSKKQQGQLQGVNQSLMSIYQIIAPFVAGIIYLSHPIIIYVVATILMVIAFLCYSSKL